MDLVVATPGRLGEHLAAGTLTLERCRMVVLDETDVLLGDAGAFREQARPARVPTRSLFVVHSAHAQRAAAVCPAPLALLLLQSIWPHLSEDLSGIAWMACDVGSGCNLCRQSLLAPPGLLQ